jgi:ferredoxin-fold anticodon binding domain-containing protein
MMQLLAEEKPNRKMRSKVMSLLEEEELDSWRRESVLLRSNAIIVWTNSSRDPKYVMAVLHTQK